jgi:hypothetical protein
VKNRQKVPALVSLYCIDSTWNACFCWIPLARF